MTGMSKNTAVVGYTVSAQCWQFFGDILCIFADAYSEHPIQALWSTWAVCQHKRRR